MFLYINIFGPVSAFWDSLKKKIFFFVLLLLYKTFRRLKPTASF